MTPLCAVRRRHRSSSLRARPVHARCTSLPQLRRCASRTFTASTCRRRSELVAAGRSHDEIARLIGADWLVYQDLEDLIAACKHEDARVEEFDTSCFSGEYVTGDVTPEYLERLQLERSDDAKALRRERRGKLKVIR